MSTDPTHNPDLLAAGEPAPLLTPQAPASPETFVPNRGGAATAGEGLAGFQLPDWSALEWIGYSSLVVISLLLTAVAVSTLWWMLHAWRSKDNLEGSQFSEDPLDAAHSFTLLVPGRHEEEVMGQTLDRLALQDHPDFEIIAIVGHDDPGTERVAREAAARHPELIRVIVDSSVPKNKPKALNLALQSSRGEIVGVFDAEDEVHPRLLTLVDSRFTETDADVVQGGVQLMNFQSSWWSLRNVLEYYFWFRSRLHFHAKEKFIPLGGNTVFVRKEWLDWSEGWDAECLAEDCELGVRLSSAGAKVVVAYSPEVVTREETPGTFVSLLKQRTRWNQGFMQVYGKGEWKKLPRLRQRLMARYLLTMPFIQAATGLMIPISIALILTVKVPTAIALVSFIPLAPTLVLLAVEFTGLREFGRTYGQKVRARDYFRLVWGLLPYQIFLALAAVRSVWRQVRKLNAWEKTEHTGAHRPAAVPAPLGHAAPTPTTDAAGRSTDDLALTGGGDR
ncbi:glycosyltransferase family 2 protein [Frigoribacterium sp. CFBP9039]|uniref:glycosyltransferase n=1 Tax=Frigoribacterium TaxID=96492 RepID=UPI001FAE6593|nr:MULTISPECIES: glycosyltransferase family 2 protein [Frigoribacterium]MCJ0701322.1 glycosyltransferase family 2 protein [Frigoribacterium faeni]MDY0944606.1 glycosyltransferase family 2 protein [Frigoribacterium sp. CFBP9039]